MTEYIKSARITCSTVIIIIGITMIGGCASIPKESPELSKEIGERISKMRAAHLSLVHRYFDLKRERVDRLFDSEWIPAYAESFFSQEQVSNYWDRLVSEGSKTERVEFLTQLGPRMLERIRQKRAEYIEPLNRLEMQVVDSLQREYRQMLAGNNTLTSFLASSSAVDKNRDRYLELMGAEPQRIDLYVDRVDRKSEKIMSAIKNSKEYN